MEVWKDIPGFENYQISNYGNVKSLNYGRTGKTKLLKPTISGKGYLQVRLSSPVNQMRCWFIDWLQWHLFKI